MKEVNRQYDLLRVRRILSPADRTRFSLILRAGSYIGVPYVLGARYGQTDTFDCSSFIKTIYAQEGFSLPRVSRQQAKVGERVSLQELRVGDLMFFTGRQSRRQIAHVAMYAGNGMMIHTYGRGGVRYTAIHHPIWKQRFVMARRVVK
ncbi:C40 family peptidase [Paenibacillus guangzhouensis]|uniref:C40 family peptidase n=1 Tax=Paenibacillus guangzhouensis TaxID=1473112 RepID=UPI0012671052|nr:C40 family peptidase [Paenibacillus guangzhouensis]